MARLPTCGLPSLRNGSRELDSEEELDKEEAFMRKAIIFRSARRFLELRRNRLERSPYSQVQYQLRLFRETLDDLKFHEEVILATQGSRGGDIFGYCRRRTSSSQGAAGQGNGPRRPNRVNDREWARRRRTARWPQGSWKRQCVLGRELGGARCLCT